MEPFPISRPIPSSKEASGTRRAIRAVISILDGLLLFFALTAIYAPTTVTKNQPEAFNDPHSVALLSVMSFGGLIYLHRRLERYLIPIRGELADELKRAEAKARSFRSRWFNFNPGNIFGFAYFLAGLGALDGLITLTSSGISGPSLYTLPDVVFQTTILPLFLIAIGLMLKSRKANQFLLNRLAEIPDQTEWLNPGSESD